MVQLQYLTEISYSEKNDFPDKFRETLSTTKVVHLKDVPPEMDLTDFYTKLTQSVGQLIRKGEDFDNKKFTNDQWLDVRYDPNHANTYRHSNTPQPLHTDGAYIVDFDYELVFLFCTQQAKYGGATTFLDADFLYELLATYQPKLLQLLEKEIVYFSKGTFGGKKVKIIDRDEKGLLVNWNYYRVADENPSHVKEMIQQFQDFLQNQVVAAGLLNPLLLQKGEAVFFHDRRVLHGRNAFLGERCLIKGALNF